MSEEENTNSDAKSEDYSAKSIQSLDGLEAVKKTINVYREYK